jgi:hypothetical protein
VIRNWGLKFRETSPPSRRLYMKTIALLVTLSCASLALPASAQTQVIRRMPAEDVTLDKLLAPETLFKYTK